MATLLENVGLEHARKCHLVSTLLDWYMFVLDASLPYGLL